ncbi:MAG TPA: hypothetical protein PK843_15220 [bacterium]|nr:hypothetical protein [bacterium]
MLAPILHIDIASSDLDDPSRDLEMEQSFFVDIDSAAANRCGRRRPLHAPADHPTLGEPPAIFCSAGQDVVGPFDPDLLDRLPVPSLR